MFPDIGYRQAKMAEFHHRDLHSEAERDRLGSQHEGIRLSRLRRGTPRLIMSFGYRLASLVTTMAAAAFVRH